MKKRFAIFVLSIIFIFSTCIVTNAQSINNDSVLNLEVTMNEDIPISLCSAYTRSTVTNLAISTSGQATATASITGYPGTTTKVIINLSLQKLQNGSWSTVKSWSKTSSSYTGTLEQKYSVAKGYSYRVKASYDAYSGSAKENIVAYSSTVKY